jgi:hypothetical protein
MAFEIKDEFLKERVGFNNSAEPLGNRSDLHLLAELALKTDGSVKDTHVMGFFKSVPTLEEIKAAKEKSFTQKQETKAASQSNVQSNTGIGAAK